MEGRVCIGNEKKTYTYTINVSHLSGTQIRENYYFHSTNVMFYLNYLVGMVTMGGLWGH